MYDMANDLKMYSAGRHDGAKFAYKRIIARCEKILEPLGSPPSTDQLALSVHWQIHEIIDTCEFEIKLIETGAA